MKKLLLPTLLLLLLTSALGQQVRTNEPPDNGKRSHAGRIIVRFRGGPELIDRSGQARGLSQQLNLFAIDSPPGMTVAEAIARYKNNPNVIYAEPDYEVQAVETIPNDPMWANPVPGQWDMVKIQAPAAWDTQTNASDVVVAIVDTGIAYAHPDLLANLWTDTTGTYSGTVGAHGFTCMGSCVAGGV